MKLDVKWQEIDEQATEDINYKKKIDQLEKAFFELRLGVEAFTNNFKATPNSVVKDKNQKVIAEKGKYLSYL